MHVRQWLAVAKPEHHERIRRDVAMRAARASIPAWDASMLLIANGESPYLHQIAFDLHSAAHIAHSNAGNDEEAAKHWAERCRHLKAWLGVPEPEASR